MKKIILPALFALLLTACGNEPVTLNYNVTFDTEVPERMNDLSLAARHVMERRLAAMNANLIDYDVTHNKETLETGISVKVDDKTAAEQLNQELTTPFNFEVRYLVDKEQEGDIYVENIGYFRASGVTGNDVDWVLGEAIEGPQDQGRVIIGFTDEGVTEMQDVFSDQNGSVLGLFVRGRLMASMETEGETITRTIEIPGVPSGDLAKVFADDMNVGIHMTFTPVQ